MSSLEQGLTWSAREGASASIDASETFDQPVSYAECVSLLLQRAATTLIAMQHRDRYPTPAPKGEEDVVQDHETNEDREEKHQRVSAPYAFPPNKRVGATEQVHFSPL